MSIRCEEVVAALTAGRPVRRWRASRHAARCPQCAAARDELRRIARKLSDVPPLSDFHRRLWIAAAGDDAASETSRANWFRPVLAGASATILLGTVGVWWASRPVEFQVGPTTVRLIERAADDEAPVGAASLPSVVALSRELDDLRRLADLLDARKDLETLLARLAPRGDSRGL